MESNDLCFTRILNENYLILAIKNIHTFLHIQMHHRSLNLTSATFKYTMISILTCFVQNIYFFVTVLLINLILQLIE